jgi:hypothetical protein
VADDPSIPKPWYASKMVLLNSALTLAGIALYFSDPQHTPTATVASIAAAALGVLNVVLRVWFTAAPIQGTPLEARWITGRQAFADAVLARRGTA